MLQYFHMFKTYLYIPTELNQQLEFAAKANRVTKARLMRQALQEGLKVLKQDRNDAGQILLDIASLAKKNKVQGPRDLSTKMDEYLWK